LRQRRRPQDDDAHRIVRKGGGKSEKDQRLYRFDSGLSVLISVHLRSSVVILNLLLPLILQPIVRASHLNIANGAHLARAILPCYKYLRAE
jgi:hypothetical protein